MIRFNLDKNNKTLFVVTDYDFTEVEITKHRDYFHLDFIKNKNKSMGCCLFFNIFGGRKNYPETMDIKTVSKSTGSVKLIYTV